MSRTVSGRLAYADRLRTVATIAVIVLHLSGSQLTHVPVDSWNFTLLNAFDALTRWCVPMFVLLSGAFLLDPEKPEPLNRLLLRILRLVVALGVWASVYAIADHMEGGGRLNWDGIRSALWNVVLGQTHYHLWFLYTIIGLYLVTPLLRAFVRGATRTDFHWFFLLSFLLASLLPTLLQFHPSQTLSLYLKRLDLHLVLGYAGYYVAGYYLKTFPLRRKTRAVLYALGLLGGFVTLFGTQWLSLRQGSLNGTLYSNMAPNVVFSSVALFVLFRSASERRPARRTKSHCAGMAQRSLGIYLVHDLFLMLLRAQGITVLSFSPLLSVPVLTAVVFVLAYAAAWLLSKLPLFGPYLT